jgi:hypothetical protein
VSMMAPRPPTPPSPPRAWLLVSVLWLTTSPSYATGGKKKIFGAVYLPKSLSVNARSGKIGV